MKVVFFGNCQAWQLHYLFSKYNINSNVEMCFFSSNSRTGDKKNNDEILNEIQSCDVLIAQPLSSKHNELSSDNISSVMKKGGKYIKFPYIFNSGISSLLHAPSGGGHAYGEIFGKEIILSLADENISKGEIISRYVKGEIDFDLKNRFHVSLDIMRSKESALDIKLTDFILKNNKKERLFISHNHPSNKLFHELVRQILDKVDLPIDFNGLLKDSASLPETNCPMSPFDKEVLGYQFSHDRNWLANGVNLIDLILFKPIGFTMLKNHHVNSLRDAALIIEGDNLELAESLMSLAHIGRPDGPYINIKLNEYKNKNKN